MTVLINTRFLTLSIVPRWSFGYWNECGMVTIDAGCLCCEVIYG